MILTPEQVQKVLASMTSQRDVVGKAHMALQSFDMSALPAAFATQFTALKAQVDAHLATLPPTDLVELALAVLGEAGAGNVLLGVPGTCSGRENNPSGYNVLDDYRRSLIGRADGVLVVNGGEELDSVSRGELELAESLGKVLRWSAPAEEAPEAGALDNSDLEYLPRLLEADLAAGSAQVHSEVDQDDLARRGLRFVSTAEAARLLGVGPTYITALKKAAGVKGGLVSVPELLKYRRGNPGFKQRWAGEAVTDVPLTPEDNAQVAAWVRELRGSRPDRRSAASGRSGGLSR